jgi:hypothetical protein
VFHGLHRDSQRGRGRGSFCLFPVVHLLSFCFEFFFSFFLLYFRKNLILLTRGSELLFYLSFFFFFFFYRSLFAFGLCYISLSFSERNRDLRRLVLSALQDKRERRRDIWRNKKSPNAIFFAFRLTTNTTKTSILLSPPLSPSLLLLVSLLLN